MKYEKVVSNLDDDLLDLLMLDSAATSSTSRVSSSRHPSAAASSSSSLTTTSARSWLSMLSRRFWALILFVVVMTVSLSMTDSLLLRIHQFSRNLQRNNNSNSTTSSVLPATTTQKTSSDKVVTAADAVGRSTPATFPFRYRGPKLDKNAKATLAEKWGQWSQLKDTKKAPRPALPCHDFDHCDVPRNKFPSNAWQTDPEFLKQFLTQAQALITRAQEAILAEYGQSKYDKPNKTLAERSLNFQLDLLLLDDGNSVHPPDSRKINIDNGGWTTHRSFEGLVRRLLHAVVTQDTFTFALGGHSIAAGHGNHFKQSYAMQFHRTMEPVFGRLGVKLNTHNFGHGALGTTQDAMGMGSLWGPDVDFCMWDAGMTEHKSSYYDLFARQALIGGNRVPILWNGMLDVMEVLHKQADVDIGGPGTGLRGMPITESAEQAKMLPYAVRNLKCSPDQKDLCDDNRYKGRCWVNRPDVTPPTKQGYMPGGQARHHPGFRSHQLTGRVLAFTMLSGLQEALQQWNSAPNYALPDSAWHVTAHYQNIRNKLAMLTTTPCFSDATMPSPRICHTPMKAVSEYTPRVRPEFTSIRSIMKDTTYMTAAKEALFHGPDVANPDLEPPATEINYLAIVENDDAGAESTSISGRQLVVSNQTQHAESPVPLSDAKVTSASRRLEGGIITPLPVGRGWAPHIKHGDIHCNGTYDSDECGRDPRSSCLLSGHNDGRGGLMFDSLSGWLLLRLKDVKEGLIIIKMETWLHPGDIGGYYAGETNELTEGWTEENNGATKRHLLRNDDATGDKLRTTTGRQKRDLKKEANVAPDLCPEFTFDYAINGRMIESLTKAEFFLRKKFVQRVVETLTLLDNPDFTKDAATDVEIGIRMRGCQRINTFKLTHVYWA